MKKDNEFEISIFKDCVQYSETDSIGFFNCPNCETQRYYNGEVGDVYTCDCNAKITFKR